METIHEEQESHNVAICRICWEEGTPDYPLLSPCRCSGSMGHVHQECLATWVVHRQDSKCNVCQYRFRRRRRIRPVSPDDLRFLWQELWRTLCLALTGLRRMEFMAVCLSLMYLFLFYHGVVFTVFVCNELSCVLADWILGPVSAAVYLCIHGYVAYHIWLVTGTRRLLPLAVVSFSTAYLAIVLCFNVHHLWLTGTLLTNTENAGVILLQGWKSDHVVLLFAGSYLLCELAYLMLLVIGRMLTRLITVTFDAYIH